MENIFMQFLNLSYASGWLIVIAILLRFAAKKVPRKYFCILWGLAGIRLAFPFNIESPLSLVPSANIVTRDTLYDSAPELETGVELINNAVNPTFTQSFAAEELVSVNPLQIFMFVSSYIWVIGICVLVLYALFSAVRIKSKLKTAVLSEDNIYMSEYVSSPFVFGIIKPKIYVPFSLGEPDLSHVVLHEKCHIRRLDHLTKAIAYAILALHWFNPLVWTAFILFCRDTELACDEAVTKNYDEAERKAYSAALLNCSSGRIRISACPVAFGEIGVKERIKNVMSIKRPTVYIAAVSVIVIILAAIFFLTSPAVPASPPSDQYITTDSVYNHADYENLNDSSRRFWVSESGDLMTTPEVLYKSSWEKLGKLEEYKLKKSEFDNMLSPQSREKGYSAEFIRENTEASWICMAEGEKEFYILLQLDNGEIYIAYGYDESETGEKAVITNIFRLVKVRLDYPLETEAGDENTDESELVYGVLERHQSFSLNGELNKSHDEGVEKYENENMFYIEKKIETDYGTVLYMLTGGMPHGGMGYILQLIDPSGLEYSLPILNDERRKGIALNGIELSEDGKTLVYSVKTEKESEQTVAVSDGAEIRRETVILAPDEYTFFVDLKTKNMRIVH